MCLVESETRQYSCSDAHEPRPTLVASHKTFLCCAFLRLGVCNDASEYGARIIFELVLDACRVTGSQQDKICTVTASCIEKGRSCLATESCMSKLKLEAKKAAEDRPAPLVSSIFARGAIFDSRSKINRRSLERMETLERSLR
jgi:hypothetical protein